LRGFSRYYELRYKASEEILKEFADLPTRTVARMLHDKYPKWYPSVEIARSFVRWCRGRMGEISRSYEKRI
jgi:hypothetical protein